MSNFKLLYLRDIAESQTGPFGSQLHQSDYVSEGTPMVTVEHLGVERFTHQNLPFVSDKDRDRLSKYILKEGDIVFSRVGSVDRCTYVTKEEDGWMFSGRCIRVRTGKNASGRYLNFYFRQESFRKMMLDISVGATMPSLNTKLMDNIPLRLPILENQYKIAKVLSDLDAKIELNNKINTELEVMAKTLYDYWFVQFDFPDAYGKTYKTNGGKMVWSDELKRKIPEGWEVDSLSSWIKNDKSGDWGKEQEEGNYNQKVYCIRGADINGLNGKGEVKSPERYILEKNLHKVLDPHDLIVEISGGSPVQSTGRLAYITEETLHRFDAPIICSNFCKAVTLKNKHYFYNFVYQWNSVYDAGVLFGYEGKTSGIKNLLFESFASTYHTAIPPKELAEKFYEFMKPIQIKKEKNLKENQELASLRDWLLPMLMNGQVSVGEVEEKLGMVAEPEHSYESNRDTFKEIFDQLNFDYEIAAIVSLTFQSFQRSYGKKYIHKMFSNIELLNTIPVFKELAFEEKGWGMFSSQIRNAIEAQKFIKFGELKNNQKVLELNFKHFKEITAWIKHEDNKEFVLQVNNMLAIYENPIINKKMDSIELFNTVLECIKVLKTYDFQAIYNKMENWPMVEEGYATKADKFKPTETKAMISFIKEIKN